MLGLDAFILARIQFAFTVSFHILFPAITIGLASYLAVLEGMWLKTHNPLWRSLYKFWLKIFAVNFGMGVVSGLVMAYQFGTNWSGFSQFAGSITGPLLTYEVLTAFFLEAGFLGVMLFGWNKVGPGLHFFSTCMVALGTLMSTFWILASNSWMQTPQGHEIINGQVVPVDWFAVIFNPSFPYRLLHMSVAAFLSSAMFVGASAAWHLLKGNDTPAVRKMFSMALWMALLVAPIQAVIGDMHGLNTLKHQPAKIAAIEGHWENPPGEPTPLLLVGWPDMEQERTRYGLEIPALGSLILTHSLDQQVPALKDFPKEDRPNSTIVFWSFRIMVGMGVLMIALGVASLWLRYRGRLYQSKPFLRFAFWMGPSGLIALLAGWVTTEVGRQPWVVYGLMRTRDAVSAHSDLQMSISLLVFIVVYSLVFGVGYLYLIRLIKVGPQPEDDLSSKTDGRPARPISAVGERLEEEQR
ncbi:MULTISPECIES: cytochrome ubiquinol oxidase subunit I [Atlantibacter]|nr:MULTISPECIES: cytochrome ubiquinol oxidase subunit I [Atlantibacter]MCQ4967493.1 cytochrome ubiquinol oxidase subunit I [Enterobacteriaceae bacterium DFI.7.85]MDQ7881592.1 cytochrome ubiquinol oxidase subunit I [Atlantibacter hermannii]MDU1949892.1 cytochrome ubiquinol oxidase subunit I [Atlantibacter hermannii]MDW4575563.1 cytochrome ubiquinol oxidase subunit I [Atlantibacter hermannii]MEB7923232.1 cytochrome ubiquinol oxidase subunit I [Atlantibacter hermannii]